MTNDQFTGSVTITRADSVAQVVSGTFEFTAVNAQTGETRKVTKGRFDYETH